MEDELRIKVKQHLYEVSAELNDFKPKTIIHQIETLEDIVTLKRFKGILDPKANMSWLIPEVGPVFKFWFDSPDEINKRKKENSIFSIDEIHKYIHDYIHELDDIANGNSENEDFFKDSKTKQPQGMKEFAKEFLIKNKKKYYSEKPGEMIKRGFKSYKVKYPNTTNKESGFHTEYYKAAKELMSENIL